MPENVINSDRAFNKLFPARSFYPLAKIRDIGIRRSGPDNKFLGESATSLADKNVNREDTIDRTFVQSIRSTSLAEQKSLYEYWRPPVLRGSTGARSRHNCFLLHYVAREVFTRLATVFFYNPNKRRWRTMSINKLNSRETPHSISWRYSRQQYLGNCIDCATRLSNWSLRM